MPQAAALAEELIRFQMLAGRMVVLVSHDAQRDRAAGARTPAAGGCGAPGHGAERRRMSAIDLSVLDLGLAALLLVVNGAISLAFGLRLETSLAVAAVRMVVQLAAVGFVLKFVFAQSSPLWTLAIAW